MITEKYPHAHKLLTKIGSELLNIINPAYRISHFFNCIYYVIERHKNIYYEIMYKTTLSAEQLKQLRQKQKRIAAPYIYIIGRLIEQSHKDYQSYNPPPAGIPSVNPKSIIELFKLTPYSEYKIILEFRKYINSKGGKPYGGDYCVSD